VAAALGAATQEIVRNVGRAAQAAAAMVGHIAGVAAASKATDAATHPVLRGACRTEPFPAEVGRFLAASVRAA